jgi:uncharacterized protein
MKNTISLSNILVEYLVSFQLSIRKLKCICIIISVVLIPALVHAQIPKPKPNTYVDDYTNRLSADQINDLNLQFRQLENNTGVQVAAVLVNDLPENITIEDYAREIGNTWKVGRNHNGLVYVAVLNIRRQRLEVAENLEGDIPDATAFEIIESLKPSLQQEDYYGALSVLVNHVANQLGTNVYDQDSSSAQAFQPLTEQQTPESDFDKESAKHSRYANIVLVMLGIMGIVFSIWAYRYRKKYMAMYTVNGVYTGIGSIYYSGAGSDDSDSGGGFGGFGGGGGGGFSGGGASGGW